MNSRIKNNAPNLYFFNYSPQLVSGFHPVVSYQLDKYLFRIRIYIYMGIRYVSTCIFFNITDTYEIYKRNI